MGTNCLVALGSNQQWEDKTPSELVLGAISELSKNNLEISKVSRLYKTPCFPAGVDPDFVNAAMIIKTCLEPGKLLWLLHDLEEKVGRVRQIRWGSRTLDIDLLSYGDFIMPDRQTYEQWQTLEFDLQQKYVPEQLILPHPRLQERAFVLGPLMDIAPKWRHPVLGKTVEEMFLALPDLLRAELEVLSL